MSSKKISQMTPYLKPQSIYDRLPIITPTVDVNNPTENVSIPVRSIWSPTLLVELISQTPDTVGNSNVWKVTTILPSDEALYNPTEQAFTFTAIGLFEVVLVGETLSTDSYGVVSSWPIGQSLLDVSIDRAYTKTVPRDDPSATHRIHNRYSDAFTPSDGCGFTERFWLNITDYNSLTISKFMPYAIVHKEPGAYYFKTRMAVSVKRIADPIVGLDSL